MRAAGWVCAMACSAAVAQDGVAGETGIGLEAKPLGIPASRIGAASDGSKAGGGIPTAAALAGVVALAVVAGGVVRVVARRSGGLMSAMGPGGRAPAGVMEILGRYPVGRGTSLVLLKIDRRILLLSQSATGRLGMGSTFTTLSEITDAEEVGSILVKTRDAEGESLAERFRGILGKAEQGYAEPQAGRRVRVSAGGDRAEMWDDRSGIPVIDLTRNEKPGGAGLGAAAVLRQRLAEFGGRR
jgi:hypothetical protein